MLSMKNLLPLFWSKPRKNTIFHPYVKLNPNLYVSFFPNPLLNNIPSFTPLAIFFFLSLSFAIIRTTGQYTTVVLLYVIRIVGWKKRGLYFTDAFSDSAPHYIRILQNRIWNCDVIVSNIKDLSIYWFWIILRLLMFKFRRYLTIILRCIS